MVDTAGTLGAEDDAGVGDCGRDVLEVVAAPESWVEEGRVEDGGAAVAKAAVAKDAPSLFAGTVSVQAAG